MAARSNDQPSGKAYYVSTQGNDQNSGSKEDPLRTIQRATELMEPGDTCYVREGVYHESVKPAVNGTQDKPITITAYEGETVVLSGCRQLTGWTQDPNKEGVWKAPMTWSLGEDGCENQIFADGAIMWEARYPNIQAGDTMTNFTRGTSKQGTGLVAGTNNEKSQLVDPDLAKAAPNADDLDGATLWDVPGAGWTALTSKVETYDPATGTLTYSSTARGKTNANYRPGAGSRYYVFGSYGLLDTENEWWYDQEHQELYLMTPGGVNPDEAGILVEAKEYHNAFDLSDCSYITIDGIDVRGATVVTNEASSHIKLHDMHMEYVGHNSSLVLGTDNSNAQDDLGVLLKGTFLEVNSCEIAYSSGPLINVQGSDNTVVNCYLHDGNYIGSYCGHTKLSGRRQLISNNTMTDSGRDTVSFRNLSESVVQYNDISGSGRLTKDLGIMYAAGTDGQNTLIHHNAIHDSYNPNASNDMGLYLDEMTHNMIIFNNVIWNVKNYAMCVNQPSLYNLVYNNTGYSKSTISDSYNASFSDSTGRQFINNYFSNKSNNTYTPNSTWYYNNSAPDAGFTDAAGHDFTIGADSALAGAGVPIQGVSQSVPSIGAYEPNEPAFTVGHNFENPPEILPAPDVTEFEYRNLVRNGGFEYGTLESWDGEGQVVKEDSWHATNKTAATCLYGLVLDPGQAVTQRISVKPNTTYTLAVNSRSNAGSQITYGVEGLAAGDLLDTQDNKSSKWSASTKDYMEFTTGPEDKQVVIRIANAGQEQMFVDDVGLQKKVQLIGDLSQELTVSFDEAAQEAVVTFEALESGHTYYYMVSDTPETTFEKGNFVVEKPQAYQEELTNGARITARSMQYLHVVEVVNGQVIGFHSQRLAEVQQLSKVSSNDGFVRGGTYSNQVMNQVTQPNAFHHVEENTQYYINLNKSNDVNYNRVGYFQFDLTDIQPELVNQAVLRFYIYQTNPSEDAKPGEGMNRTIEIKEVAGENWDEDTLSWTSALSGDAPLQPGKVLGSVSGIYRIDEPNGRYIEVDLTDYIREKAEAGTTATVQVSVPGVYAKGNIYIATKEHPGYSESYDGEFAPQLLIDYYGTPVDLDALSQQFQPYADVQPEGYTQESWAVFDAAREAVKALLDNPRATQAQAQAAMDQLIAAYEDLELLAPSTADKTLLEKTVAYAETLSTEGVTDAAKAAFEEALTNAKAVLADENATQEEVNDAWDALLEGIWGLGLTQGDKTMLEQLIAKAEDMIPNQDKYVQDHWQELVDALAKAKEVMNDGNAMEEDVQPAAEALLNAILAQRFKADKSILEDLLNKAENLNLEGYTADSVAVFRSALAEAQALMADETLTEDDQKTVDAAVATLSAAMDGLTAGGAPEATDQPQASQKPEATDKPENVPQTGDTASLLPWAAALALSGAAALWVVRRKERN